MEDGDQPAIRNRLGSHFDPTLVTIVGEGDELPLVSRFVIPAIDRVGPQRDLGIETLPRDRLIADDIANGVFQALFAVVGHVGFPASDAIWFQYYGL